MHALLEDAWQLTSVVPAGWLVAAYNLTTSGHPLLLCVEERVLKEVLGTQDMGLVWPQTRVAEPYRARLFELTPGGVHSHELVGLKMRALHVDLLPDARAIVCGARARFDALGAEHNANVFDLRSGAIVSEFTLGDGISHVQALEDSSIVVGYFDQGVEGALGWKQPLGASGLVRFDQHGNPLWRFPVSQKLAPMDECYALNASLEETWVYYYRDFALVRFDRAGDVGGVWNLAVQGAHAVAVAGGYAALFGSYEDSRDCCLLSLRASGQADEVYRFQLPLPPRSQVVARRGHYGALLGNSWLRGDFAALVRAFTNQKS
ncbi:MAG: hypothetical protein SFV15_04780 [Polyangiaceae bacterium]|nr:hypothetical protein [Polyangiaceae bacterium]